MSAAGNILERIAAHTRLRVDGEKKKTPPEEMEQLAANCSSGNGEVFYRALSRPEMSFICEVKKASPSKGVIDPVFNYREIAAEYDSAGADCISCLTEPKWFMGSDEVFRDIRSLTRLPMLRKDFIVDDYQIYQAKVLGADCVLLICAILDTETIRKYLKICDSLRLAALVETHDEAEISSALSAGARILGVNNRNLKDFSVDLQNAGRLRGLIPSDCLYVSESGVTTPEDAARMKSAGADAILIGEALMKSPDRAGTLAALKEAAA